MQNHRLPQKAWLSLAVLFVLIPAVLAFAAQTGGRFYYLAGVSIILLTLVPFFLVFESRRPQAREIVVLAILCALAVASRAAFGFIPHFKPMGAIVMITGLAFGPEAGFLVGAVSVFASNFILGQGPYLPWQMFAFGVAGFLFGLLMRFHRVPRSRTVLALMSFFTTLLIVGPILDTSTLFVLSSGMSQSSVAAVYLAGLPVNLIHGTAVGLTMFFCEKPLMEKLDRLKLKYGMMEGSDDAL